MALSKVKSYFQSFKESYTKDFPFIKASRKGEKFAFCELCRCDFNISHAGKYDISRHVKSTKHLDFAKSSDNNVKLDSFFKNDVQSDVIRAELLFAAFLVEHNVPIAAADHDGPLFRKMFPKCDIAKQYGSGRTKTTALIKEMASNQITGMIKQMQLGPFSAACDGSNDTDYKLYPIVISFFNPVEGLVENSLLSLPNLTGDATGENISALILSEFQRVNVPPENCIAFMADNASVMQGKNKGVVAFLKRKHQNLITMGCSCHLINLAAEKGAATLPIQVDEFLVDIYYYLNKSAKRKETLKHFQALHDKEAQKILKHVCTRWLSLGRSLTRLVHQWDPLLSFFKDIIKAQACKVSVGLSTYQIPKRNAHDGSFKVNTVKNISASCKRKIDSTSADVGNSSKKQATGKGCKKVSEVLSREEKIFMFLSSTENKAYCLFLLGIIPTFEKINTSLQSGSPLIHKLREIYLELLKELYCRFLKPSAIKNKNLLKINYRAKENQKELFDIFIGRSAIEETAELSDECRKSFFSNILKYYMASCDYIINKFPIDDEVLKNAEVANLAKIENSKFSSIIFFIKLFPCLLRPKPSQYNEVIDELEQQFCSLQIEDLSAVLNSHKRVDAQWVAVGKIMGTNGLPKYKELSDVILSILLIPHSNADCERIFSVVKKNRTEFRSGLSNNTLQNLLILKTQNSKPCFEHVFSEDMLSKAKKSTVSSMAQSS